MEQESNLSHIREIQRILYYGNPHPISHVDGIVHGDMADLDGTLSALV